LTLLWSLPLRGWNTTDGEVALRLEKGPQGYHRKNIYRDDAGGQGAVDEGAVYHQVYVVEVVAEDGDVGEDRN
jgi:hypothetical protein